MNGRRFYLQRKQDESGVSGTGRVAEGMAWEDGIAVLHWLVVGETTGIYAPTVKDRRSGIQKIKAIHGHDNRTLLIWVDENE
jgi:hypothetical protein